MWVGRWAVLLYLVAVPACISLFDRLGPHDISRVAQLVVCACCAGALAWHAAVFRGQKGSGPVAALIIGALLLLSFLSVSHAPDPAAAARELALFLGLASIVAVIAYGCTQEQFDVLAIAVAAAALLNAAVVLMIVVTALAQLSRLDPLIVVPGYDNYRFLNHVQTVLLPLTAIAIGRSFHRGDIARLAWAGLTLNFALLFFTQGRATGVALIVAALVSLLLFRRAAAPFVRRLVVAAAAGALLYFILFVAAPALLGIPPEVPRAVADLDSYQVRQKLWRIAIGYVTEQPWLGIGPMHYAHHINPIAAHPHNIYFQVASEWGVPLLLGLLAWGAWALWRMARTLRACKDAEQSTLGVALFVAVLAAAIDGLFSGNFVMPVSQVWIAFAFGWAMAWTRSNALPRADFVSARRWPVGAACCWLLLASQGWLGWTVGPEIAHLNAHLDSIRTEISKSSNPAPRFWSNGWF